MWRESIAWTHDDLRVQAAGTELDADACVVAEALDSLGALRPDLVGPLAFAGEPLAGAIAALMEGAIRSGRQAALSLLAAVRTAP